MSKTFSRFITSSPKISLLIFSIFLLFSLSNLNNFKLDASSDSLVLESDDDLKYYREVNSDYSSSEIVLFGNLHPAVQQLVIDQTINPDRFIIMDTMNFWMENTLNELVSVIKKVNLIIINDEEAEQLTSEKNIFKAAEKILETGPSKVIIKKGEHGSVYFDGKNNYLLPAYPVTSLIDPTGAGDSFAGGIAGFLSTKKKIGFEEIKEAMLYGTLTASFCVESFGIEGLRKLDKETLNRRFKIFKSYLT